MFKRIIAVFLIISTFSLSLTRVFIIAGFELNKKYIVSNLCINRNRPELHCNGKCYLMQKLKLAEENEKKQNLKLRLEIFSVYISPVKLTDLKMAVLTVVKVKSISIYSCFYSNTYYNSIFRPPKFSA